MTSFPHRLKLQYHGQLATRILSTLLLLTTASDKRFTVLADYPTPQPGDCILTNFTFHTGEIFPKILVHYITIGTATGEPVLLLHGTAGSAASLLTSAFAGELFGPGQPLDVSQYYLIIPDALGAGASSKPSDGLRTSFPHYNYDDMVNAQYQLVREHLAVPHLRLILGNSMGGMLTWLWAVSYPSYMDAAVPLASLPTAMSGRNRMMRRFIIDAIHTDPDWLDGNYTKQPKSLHCSTVYFGIATNGGNLGLQKLAGTRAQADTLLDQRLSEPFNADANDYVYQWDASRDYDPLPRLGKIEAKVLAINSADDERNPPDIAVPVFEREMPRVRNGGAFCIIPESAETVGHGTTGMAKLWKDKLADSLAKAPVLSTATPLSYSRSH